MPSHRATRPGGVGREQADDFRPEHVVIPAGGGEPGAVRVRRERSRLVEDVVEPDPACGVHG